MTLGGLLWVTVCGFLAGAGFTFLVRVLLYLWHRRKQTLPHARGQALDNIGFVFGLERMRGERDAAYRRRMRDFVTKGPR